MLKIRRLVSEDNQLAPGVVSNMTLTTVSQNKCFGGVQSVYSHASHATGCDMRFGVFLPPQAETHRVPVLY